MDMDIYAPVIFSTATEYFLCFNHAVKRAMAGYPVEAVADDSRDSEYNMGPSSCVACRKDETIIIKVKDETD